MYEHQVIEIVKTFIYCTLNIIGIVFTTGGSFSEAQNTLAGQAQNAIFKLNKYLYKFMFVALKHKLDLFDKLIKPLLNYSCEIWGFCQANAIEKLHMQFCKKLLGVKKTTQTDFVYEELGRDNYATKRVFIIIRYWLKYYKVSKGAKIRNRYNQVPHLTQDTNGKVTNSQLDTTNESQEVSPFPAGDHKAHINRRAQRHSKRKTEKT